MLTRTRSTVPAELDELAERVIGMCIAVHNELGPGMNEGVYTRACRLEFEANGPRSEVSRSNSPGACGAGGKLPASHRIAPCSRHQFQRRFAEAGYSSG